MLRCRFVCEVWGVSQKIFGEGRGGRERLSRDVWNGLSLGECEFIDFGLGSRY